MGLSNQKKVIVGLLALVLSLMVGYAVFSESLNIGGTASTGSSDFNIIFSKINGISEKGSSNATANIVSNGKKLEVSVPKLQYPTSYAEFDVTIKNEGEINAILTGIETEGLDNEDIKVTYSGISQDEVLGSNQEKRMKIKVTWDETSTNTSANASFTITITYEQDTEGRQTTTTPQKTYAVGDEFCLGEECFYTIKDSGNTVTAFAKYNLDLNSNLQSQSVGIAVTKLFSETNYWSDRGLSYPADVYDSNSLLYEHVENYENYLKSTLSKTSVSARLITYDELESLGCSGDGSSCLSAPSWVYDTNYWSACANNNNNVWIVDSGGSFGNIGFDIGGLFGVRPVITISKSDI